MESLGCVLSPFRTLAPGVAFCEMGMLSSDGATAQSVHLLVGGFLCILIPSLKRRRWGCEKQGCLARVAWGPWSQHQAVELIPPLPLQQGAPAPSRTWAIPLTSPGS